MTLTMTLTMTPFTALFDDVHLSSTLQATFLCLCVLVLYLYLKRRRARLFTNPRRLPSPPGPKPLPVIGNLLDIPREKEAATYYNMAEKYGDLVHLSVLGQNILIVSSFQTANELFEKRSSNYSDRNEMPMIKDLMGWDFSFGHMPYGPRWKAHRTMFHKQFQSSVVSSFWPTQLKEAHKLIRRMLHEPNDLINHLRFNSASTIMNVTYGIEISDHDDHYIVVAETALEGMAKAAHPGAFLVDIFPILKHVPDWMPFAEFKRKAKYWRKHVMEMKDAPFEQVKAALKQGTASPSFVSNLLSDMNLQKTHDGGDRNDELEETIRNCAGLAYAAGAESVVSSLSSFILALLLHPEVQDKAQAELDSVLGTDRLPDFNDRKSNSLPYIDAIVKEVLRWSPVAPLGLPHMVTKDDEFRGYHIPAGTMVLGNSWTILHDPSIYPSPMTFNPDRFLSDCPNPTDPISVAFGYGRRICPGRFMAEAQLWISIACILTVFRVSKPSGGEEVKAEFKSGMICHPEPFKYSIEVRSEKARRLIEQTIDLA